MYFSIWLSCHQAIHTEIFTGHDSPMDKWHSDFNKFHVLMHIWSGDAEW